MKIKPVFIAGLLFSNLSFSQQLNTTWPVLKTYEGKYLDEVAMPLGGIGTGGISVGGRGDLRDWEIMNRGAIGFLPAFKLVDPTIANGPFFAIYYKKEDQQQGNIRVLEGPIAIRNYYGDWGADAVNSGFPRFEKTIFSAAYPLAQVNFGDKEVPLDIRLEAFNPLVPGDENKSGMPVAILRYVIKNTSTVTVQTSVCGMIPNYIGIDGWTGNAEGNVNTFRKDREVQGIYMHSERKDTTQINWGTIALTTTANKGVTYRTSWKKLGWNWTFREFWDDLIADGELTDFPENDKTPENTGIYSGDSHGKIKTPPATLAVKNTLAPGESATITFMITWHFPNRRAWDNGFDQMFTKRGTDNIVGNYYTTQYADAWDVADKTAQQLPELERETVGFVKAFTESDIPAVIKEAALFNVANLRCQTVFRTKDGRPFAWEGTGSIKGTVIGGEKSSGWGFGSCTHVWNYETATPFLFGNLASKFREVEFMQATKDNGGMEFRIPLPLHQANEWVHRAADGQMGCIVRAYREWQLSGNDNVFKPMWPNIKKALSFAWGDGKWDTNKDGVMEGSQHNTMDINYVGPNPQMSAWYLAALRAGEEMAKHMNDKAFEKEVHELYVQGRKWVDENLFNGEYYEQHIPEGESKVAQLGKGCLVDQLIGQNIAMTAGLGYVLDRDHESATLKSIMKYNLVTNFNDHFNTFRSFGVGHETGLIMASYPHGDLLDFPFPYYTEIMTGFEYSAATQMIYEGQVEEGEKIYKAIRDRFDGNKRNPFNEGEYGHRYGRAMASWTGILAYTGFQYSALKKSMSFNDRNGKYFWSNGYNYGTVTIADNAKGKSVNINCLNGDIVLNEFSLAGYGKTSFKKGMKFVKGQDTAFFVTNNDTKAGLPVNSK